MKAVSTNGLVAKNLLPFMGVQFEHDVRFKTADGTIRKFAVFTYQAYNARGLIGSEMNGVAVCDQDNRSVVCDGIACQDTGYFGASQKQMDEVDRICSMGWDEFRAFINAQKRLRQELAA